MPTYTYRCGRCSHEFVELEKFTDKRLTVCPSCHSPSLVRIIGGGTGVVFKGSGFYSTDYKKPHGGHSKKAETKPEAKPDGKAKPEKKSDKKTDG